MKGKFKLLGHIGMTLFLLSALMLALVPAVPVAAATAVTEVWVEFPAADAGASADTDYNVAASLPLYRIHFKPTTALERGVDTITVQFPDGSDTTMGPSGSSYAFTVGSACATGTNFDVDPDGPGVTYGYYDCSSASYGGKRLTVTLGVDVPAGSEAYLMIDDASSMVTSGAAHETTPYKVKVHTSKDTTPTLSTGFYLGTASDVVGSTSVSVSPDTAGSTGQYEISFTPTEDHTANTDTITVIFPYGTTVPSSISASSVQVSANGGTDWSTCGQAPTVDTNLNRVTVTTPVGLSASTASKIKFLTTAGIANPTTAYAYWGYTTTASRVGFIRTSNEPQNVVMDANGYEITYSTPTALDFDYTATNGYSDKYTMINMYSSVLYLQVEDTYGNKVTGGSYASAEVTLGSSSSTGNFYTGTTTLVTGTQALSSGAVSLRYKDSTAGTHTLTASYSGLTSASWTMEVVGGVALYDSSNNLINTYAPTTSSPVQENSGYHSGDYISDATVGAIAASMQGDTVKLATGTYEVDTVITLNKKITLTSVSGASHTTLVPTTDAIDAIKVYTDGTAAYPIIIDGLAFTRLRYGVEFDQAIYNNGYDYVTVQNCTFDYILPANEADYEYGAVVGFILHPQEDANAGTITSGTISNNTFTNCCPYTAPAGEAAVINIMTKASAASATSITGITISGNTLTNCNGINININGYYGQGGVGDNESYVTASITDNTLTNPIIGIDIQRQTHSVSVLRNTVTGAFNAALFIESYDSGDPDSLVIKNNTFTGTAGANKTYFSSRSGAVVIEADAGAAGTDPVIQYNAIYNNDANYSIYIVTSGLGAQDCKYNWYGDASGPYYSALVGATVTKSNTSGAGKKVSDQVTYYPWLSKSLVDVVADNVSYQACNMGLVAGWNTLSTPVKLISTADSIDELLPSGMTIGYYYDSGWHQITTGYVLNPCDAVYVKMSTATDVLFQFDAGAFTNPSKDLDVGWNLISMAALDSDGKYDKQVVASVYTTAAGLPGYSQLVSPSLNATRYDMYYNTGTSWTYSRDETTGIGTTLGVFAGMGYWVYMQNACTLAGFEITPIAPDLD